MQRALHSVEVVLVSPRNPLNIGAAARAMANFGFSRLTVVAPFEPHWREARSAVGAPEILRSATESPSLREAVTRCTLVVGTAAFARRTPEQRVVLLPSMGPIVDDELARGGRVAIVFGPEKRGLTREDLSQCHLLVEIPTDPQQPSMNLGQAVAVCLYELAARPAGQLRHDVSSQSHKTETWTSQSGGEPAATSQMLDRLAGVIEQVTIATDYSPQIMHGANRHDLRLMLRRMNLTEVDARRILGVFRRIVWRLRHPVR